MPEEKVHKQVRLKCLDCGLEFTGTAIWVVHTIGSDPHWKDERFLRADTPCPGYRFHAVTLRDA